MANLTIKNLDENCIVSFFAVDKNHTILKEFLSRFIFILSIVVDNLKVGLSFANKGLASPDLLNHKKYVYFITEKYLFDFV
ncbi:hypothetical protein HZS_7834 [Henneguya salminicola]|nr:hypothetical protein HZS_7834 [Henneguya salminicola]